MAVVANADIKYYAMQRGVKLWQLAKKLGYKHENSLSRKMREELTKEEKERYYKAIDEVAEGGV